MFSCRDITAELIRLNDLLEKLHTKVHATGRNYDEVIIIIIIMKLYCPFSNIHVHALAVTYSNCLIVVSL